MKNNQKGFAKIIWAIIILVLLLVVAIFWGLRTKTPTAAGTPTPSVSSTPQDETSGWQIYRHFNYNIEFKYPPDFAFINPQGYFLQEPIVSLKSAVNKYPGTNYSESFFTVSTDSNKDLKCLKGEDGKKLLTDKIGVNGIEFYKDKRSDAGAGNFYDSTIYRTFRDGTCYEVSLTIHTTNIGNYTPGTVKEIDPKEPMKVLEQMFLTFKFTSQ
ncbi:MAG: hypothetical protein CEN90_453 [Parcubacteria group bacterium Licking1014_17]|nr:MAG: hypothetical protein CEN90_453 [Parcubacteria group bacterium Licking1014_17]